MKSAYLIKVDSDKFANSLPMIFASGLPRAVQQSLTIGHLYILKGGKKE